MAISVPLTSPAGMVPAEAPTALVDWVRDAQELTQPARVHWCSGSEAEYAALLRELESRGELSRLDPVLADDQLFLATETFGHGEDVLPLWIADLRVHHERDVLVAHPIRELSEGGDHVASLLPAGVPVVPEEDELFLGVRAETLASELLDL